MKNKILSIALGMLAIGALTITSCQKEDGNQPTNQKVTIGDTDNSCVAIMAGQNINAGEVCFSDYDSNNDGVPDVLRVCFNTTGGWELVETHFFIGNSVGDIPMNGAGNPIPGQFPYKSGNITGETSYCFDIPFSAFGMSCPSSGTKFTIAAHASVRKLLPGGTYQTETGWGAGDRIKTKGNWGTYFTIKICCDTTCPVSDDCNETAFAFGGSSATCFDQFAEFISNPNRWGWSNGPLAQGQYSFDLYAGAGQCDLSKGTNVGTVSVNYSGSSATVVYTTNAPYSLSEVHLYVGSDVLPTKNGSFTLAPGQYPIKASGLPEGTLTRSFTVNGLSGNIYVVAHAVVAGFECPLED